MNTEKGITLCATAIVVGLAGWVLYSVVSVSDFSVSERAAAPSSDHEADVLEFLANQHSVVLESSDDVVFARSTRDELKRLWGDFECIDDPSFQAIFNAFSPGFSSRITWELNDALFDLYQEDYEEQFVEVGGMQGRVRTHRLIENTEVNLFKPLTLSYNWTPDVEREAEHDSPLVVYDVSYQQSSIVVHVNETESRVEGLSLDQVKAALQAGSEGRNSGLSECALAAANIW